MSRNAVDGNASQRVQFDKQPTSIEAQRDALVARGLQCADPAEVEKYLLAIGYYRFSGYWLYFEEDPPPGQTRSKKFPADTTFDAVLKLYVFDRRLRLLVMEAVERLEISIRARWVQHFSTLYSPHAYLDESLFVSPTPPANKVSRWKRTQKAYRKLIDNLKARVKHSHEPFIRHYFRTYSTPAMPPLWSVAETLTLGDLTILVSLVRNAKLRHQIAREMGLPSGEVLSGVLQVFALVRNVCAHHGRLWNRQLVKRIPRIDRFEDDIVLEPAVKPDQMQARNEMYNVLVVILHMLKAQQADSSLPRRLFELIQNISDEVGLAERMRSHMGFPDDWRMRPIWLFAGQVSLDPSI